MKNKIAFTLIEILVVVTIISLLAMVAVVSYGQLSKQSRDAKRKADLEQIRAALEMYRSNSDTNSYPGSLSTLTAEPKYIQSIPTDPKYPTYTYYYTGSATDYTLGTYLEGITTTCGGSCGTKACNYCLGPYGKM